MVILKASGSPATTATGMTRGAHERGVVGVVAVGRPIGGLEDVAPEALRSLGRRELGAVHRLDDLRGGDALDRVDDRERRYRPVMSGVDRVDDPLEHLARCQRARRVVDQHDVDVAPQGPEATRDGLLPGRSSGHHRDQVPPVTGGLDRIRERIALTTVRCDDDDLCERPRQDTGEGMPEDAVPVDADERLRSACP